MTRMSSRVPEEKIAELKAANSEANLILADLKRTLKEIQNLKSEVEKMIEDRCDERVESAVADGLAKLEESTQQAMSDSVEKVQDEFQKLEDILLGRDSRSKKKGLDDLPTIIAKTWCSKHQQLISKCFYCEKVVDDGSS